MDHFCEALKSQNAAGKLFPCLFSVSVSRNDNPHLGKSSDLYLGFQCFSADTITTFLFSTSFDQLSFPDFQGDIVQGVDVAMPTITLRKFSTVFVWLMRNFPPSILMHVSPSIRGLFIFRWVSCNDVIILKGVKKPLRRSGTRFRAYCETPAKCIMHLIGLYTASCWILRPTRDALYPLHYNSSMKQKFCSQRDRTPSGQC